jgi:hypothetical protein
MLKNLVVYASETGNTKKLAEVIFDALPLSMGDKAIVDVRSWNGRMDAENYFIGFWINRGSCNLEIIDLLSSLSRRNIAIFGTCGMGGNSSYYQMLEQNTRVWISDSNNFIGSYFCLGRMQECIRQKYESYRGICDDHKLDLMLEYYDNALSHPDTGDFLKAHLFTESCVSKIQALEKACV